LVLAALVVAAILAPVSLGSGEVTVPITTDSEVRFPLQVRLLRSEIPARGAVPAALHLGGRIHEEYSRPPELRELRLEGDRHVRLDVTGLPTCGLRKLPTGPPPSSKCADAIVGRGFASIESGFPENMPIDVPTDLTVYNAGVEKGVTRLWIAGYLSPIEDAPIFVPVKVRKVSKGKYGWEAVASVPPIWEGHGSITIFNLTLHRRVISATCPGGSLLAATQSTFWDGTVFATKYRQRCR